MAQRNTLAPLISEINGHGRDAAFVANVILCWHGGVGKKIRGLLRLLREGHEVRTAQFNPDVLVVDGERRPWNVLATGTL